MLPIPVGNTNKSPLTYQWVRKKFKLKIHTYTPEFSGKKYYEQENVPIFNYFSPLNDDIDYTQKF